ncbi:MAG TPA: hypothetical protein VFF66_12100 [Brevundimonas sp.]|nr:hypothetical protein [Brevundimonas sp.]
MSAASASPQTAMKRLAGALSFVCLVLFLLAIEQKQTVAAWEALRDGAGPAVRGVADWVRRVPDGAADGLKGLKAAVTDEAGPLAAEPGSAAALRGEYGPADEATRAAAGSLTFMGAELRFETGERLRTRPLRIAAGRDAFAPGQTFAARLDAPTDAQIELREVIAPAGGRGTPPSALCGGDPAGTAVLLHRRDRVDLMLFRVGPVGPDTPPTALCGAWSFTAR